MSTTVNEDQRCDVQPGDVIGYPFGMRREIDAVTVHAVRHFPGKGASIRYRYTSNPRGIDWSGWLSLTSPDWMLLSRGVAAVDPELRSLLP